MLEGNGATLRVDNPGGTWLGGPINLHSQRTSFGHNSHITIRNFNLVGSNPNTTTIYSPGSGENQHGVGIWGGSYIEITGNRISKTYGDGVYVSGNDDTHASADSVWIHDNTFTYAGRNGIALTAGTNVLIEGNSFDKVGGQRPRHRARLELPGQRRRHRSAPTAWAATPTTRTAPPGSSRSSARDSVTRDVTVTGNTVTGIARSGYDGTPRGLNTRVSGTRRQNITVHRQHLHAGRHRAGPLLRQRRRRDRDREPPAARLGQPGDVRCNCTGVVHP